jgi:S-adenosylmethionine hydrolase
MTNRPVIALLTDFGLTDVFVGQMKAILLAGLPDAQIVDISHGVIPFNIVQAGFFLTASCRHFPKGTVFLAVVDPGVGTTRRIMMVQDRGRTYFAPDNGLLGMFMANASDPVVYDVTPRKNSRGGTFHGRDLFCPLAIRFLQGEAPETFGTLSRAATLVKADWARPRFQDNLLVTHVLHIDRFGNCVLSVESTEASEYFAGWGDISLSLPRQGKTEEVVYASCYGDLGSGRVGVIPNSQGYLELAVNRGACARKLGLRIGDMVRFDART